jgi:hypothetical protein
VVGSERLLVRVDGTTLDHHRGDADADLAFATDAGIHRLISGELSADRALASGVVRDLRGDHALLERFARTFHLAA